ncbi:MAG: hypothetical protein OHK0039_16560 [Bacteroidia bacterium]
MTIKYLPLVVLLLGAGAGCRLADPGIGIGVEDVLTLTTSRDTILADGRDALVVTATLGEAALSNQEVVFRTEQGRYAIAGGFPDSDGGQRLALTTSGRTATALLIADRLPNDRVTISATVGDFTAIRTVHFARSYPTELLVTVDDPVVQAVQGARTELQVQLLRPLDQGQVSEGTRVSFSTGDPIDTLQPMVQLPPFAFAEDDVLRVPLTFVSRGGQLTVLAQVRNPNGNLLASGSVVVLFVE